MIGNGVQDHIRWYTCRDACPVYSVHIMRRVAVDALHEALEEPLVERLDEAVQGVAELGRGARHLPLETRNNEAYIYIYMQ